ncbi:MAG: hypothetical protein MZV63_07300 [Marinilabiliales bacterium]|nr:hypothetical protein [Marinilabiliales bacterium]
MERTLSGRLAAAVDLFIPQMGDHSRRPLKDMMGDGIVLWVEQPIHRRPGRLEPSGQLRLGHLVFL